MSNVVSLPGVRPPSADPNQSLISCLRALLEAAESGALQSFIGCGWRSDGTRQSLWCDHNPNVYETLGGLAWLQHEYVHRRTE